MSDKRKVNTDALETLGTIITDGGRDAIHLAVEPVEAGEFLNIGDDLVLIDGKAFASIHYPGKKAVGIADPFLRDNIKKGEKFWLIVYPRQITSLRHVWSHPDFPESDVPTTTVKQDSVKWMTEWAKEHMGYDYYGSRGDEKLSDEEALGIAISAGHNTHVGPYESAAEYINDEWWFHWEAITGVRGDREAYFSCSC